MSTQYTLTVKNDSTLSGSVCVYQTKPQNAPTNLYSLAWLAKKCHQGTELMFEWSIDYTFNWCQTGLLIPGVRFQASETQGAEPQNVNKNTVGFTSEDGAYKFTTVNLLDHVSPGSLGIFTDGTIPNNDASLGIGMGGKPAFAVNATPNYRYTFTPHPQYYVVFGEFTQGEVIDLNQCTNAYQINFPVNVYSKSLTLNSDNTWSESSLREFNSAVLQRKGIQA